MKEAYTVYRIDYIRHESEPVGMVLERRKSYRGNNFEGLLMVAKKLFSTPSQDSEITTSPE
jgi:hypothetical protein